MSRISKTTDRTLTIAERLVEEPREANYVLWPWIITIKHECNYFWLYLYLKADWILPGNKADQQSMKYKFDTFELAYEAMISFLEYVKA